MATFVDEEKMLLLHKTTELRRFNKELMKLNQEWDHIYQVTTLQMKQKMSALHMEVVGLNVKLKQEQNKKEYYEQAVLQEFKRNQQLQEYVRYLESKMHQDNERQTMVNFSEGYGTSPMLLSKRSLKDSSQCKHGQDNTKGQKIPCSKHRLSFPHSEKELIDLIDELEASKCQAEMFEAGPLAEHKAQEQMKAENENLRKKEEEIRQQMAFLQEQFKIFEDDFKKERSDKQVIQRLLSKSRSKSAGACECNSKEKLYPSSIATSARPKPGGCSKPCREGTRYCRKLELETQVSPLF